MQAPTDPREFRHSLGQFATGIAVVTAHAADGEHLGMTVNSFSSLSLDPPLVLFSLMRGSGGLARLLAADGFAINVLGAGQRELSDLFARPQDGRWDKVAHRPGHAMAPLLEGALAHFECGHHCQYEGGDHVIVVGRVLRFTYDPAPPPLLYFRGRYHGVQHEAAQA